MNFVVRPVEDGELTALRDQVALAFGEEPRPDDVDRLRTLLPLDRTACTFDGEQLVGTCGAYPLELAVPGATLPMAGTTLVTVLATHRRRGVLRAMINAHFEQAHERGELLAGLWASEPPIYGRFGYGLAACIHDVEVDGRSVSFVDPSPTGEVRLQTPAEAAASAPALYDRVYRERPGMFARSESWWRLRVLHDPEHRRDGGTAVRQVAYFHEGVVEGYARYRQRAHFVEFPEGRIEVLELVARTADAHAGLWRYLLSIDLFPNVHCWNAPLDDELCWRVDDTRRVRRRVFDALWLRLLDVPAALAARRYQDDGEIVLAGSDRVALTNEGRFALRAIAGTATCDTTAAPADVEIGAAALASLYLGGGSARELSRAGLLSGADEALRRLDRLLAWTRAPWCPEIF